MKIVVAPDSFKGSLTAIEICDITQKVCKEMFTRCYVEKIPMADGGEGTVDCLVESMQGHKVKCTVKDPLFRDITATYGTFGNNAIMEMAQASGITLVEDNKRDIFKHSTYGTGQMLLHALENGIETVYIGIGGSATNDGGIGFASAIGVKFLDIFNNELEAIPLNFEKIHSIDTSNINPLVKTATINVLCDVTNPLLGEHGATNIFGKQKGACENDRIILERGMKHYIDIAEKTLNKSVRDNKGAGAAGGLGACLELFANSKMCSGISTILDILSFKDRIYDANLVITGEGKMDYQSAYGKVASGIGKICKEENVPCIAIVGSIGERAEEMEKFGIKSITSTVNSIMTLDYAIDNAHYLFESALRRTLNLIKIGMENCPNC